MCKGVFNFGILPLMQKALVRKIAVVEQPKNQVSETHFDKHPDLSTFQCWKTSFKTDVCSCSSFLTVAMLWINEVEMVESVDDLQTSQSIGGHRFPNFEMLAAKIASALKKIITNSHFRKRVSLEEQKAQMQDRFLRGRHIACMIYECFCVFRAHDFSTSLQSDNIQNFDTRWDQALSSTKELPKDSILESLYKMRIRQSVQLQTVLAMYEQDIHQIRR